MNNLEEGSVASICSRATDMYRPKYRSEKPDAISFERSGSAPPMDTAAIYAHRALGDSWYGSHADRKRLRNPERALSVRPFSEKIITESGRY